MFTIFINLIQKSQLQGDRICVATHARGGYGTYTRDGYIYASLVGKVKIEREINNSKSNEIKNSQQLVSSLPIVSMKTIKESSVVIPFIGSLVIARVYTKIHLYSFPFKYLFNINRKITNVNPRYAKCSILSVNNVITKEHFAGQIKYKLCI